MSATYTIGMGDPEPLGKKRLFQPPAGGDDLELKKIQQMGKRDKNGKRLRTTIDLTHSAMAIIQTIQTQHRLRTGKVLPLWKLVSQAIEHYGKSKEGRQV